MSKKLSKQISKKEVKTKIKNPSLIDKRRKQIIEGALTVFKEKGFHSATVKEIAEKSGLTEGTLYNYIHSKQDIVYFVFDYVTNILREETQKGIADIKDPQERLHTALRQNLSAIDKLKDRIMFLYRESASLDKESLYVTLQRETEYIEFFEDLLRGYFKGKTVNENRLRIAADLLTYIPIIVTFRRWSLKRRVDSMDIAIQGILDFILCGIEFVHEVPGDNT
ncbi:MAG: TetR/AcrR family transcriptional regulator [Deltaproteobacteria bacterium]|jgi:AcrR family transcriptional regulator|nr:TetR/AcrR family transcriptional regulator [Deltaproteobacteria bacterium]MBT4268554.1 TetR/AcrR family transcriptional regulator [Deltaproteobacteria bacterium]MBT4638462.1 TetR/AcrR family transcriptional regulator [Deltaproteobacteria bacterium]MBT6503922.1 TetR/AcrR family transcriptional regulator [Deltaproteobacteria bacterium]MBT6611896.1 TetR/AcrR family transcriptional regulator [Deltaproteobacteria bacterium]